MAFWTVFATVNDSATATVRFLAPIQITSQNFDYELKLTGQVIPTYYIVENISGGSVKIQDSGF